MRKENINLHLCSFPQSFTRVKKLNQSVRYYWVHLNYVLVHLNEGHQCNQCKM